MNRCGWCPSDGQCYPCERADFWDSLTCELAPAFWAGFDKVMNPDYQPPTLDDLTGEPGDPVADLEALRRAWFG